MTLSTQTPSGSSSSPARAPSLHLLGLEPVRAAFEYAAMRLAPRASHPPGDGHSVVVFPGLASDQRAIAPLTRFCRGLGYAAHDWGRGFNTGPHGDVDAWLDRLADETAQLADSEGRRISLIGWSLGGIYAREIAKRRPELARQVITIGTPFAGSARQTNAETLYGLINGQRSALDDDLQAALAVAPDVPTTSIYSRSDGVVAWQACIQQDGHDQVENIEVEGSHCGLGWNTAVLGIIADRLAQPEGGWKPYAG
jgi:dienelactone hydrolase